MLQIILISFGGAIGALSRYTLSNVISKGYGTNFPLGTLAVNLVGCFAIGIIWQISEEHIPISNNAKLFFFVGLLGAFTTFSTYGLESLHLFKSGDITGAVTNILLNNILGIFLVILGAILTKEILS